MYIKERGEHEGRLTLGWGGKGVACVGWGVIEWEEEL